MLALQDLLGQEQGTEAVGEMSRSVGLDASSVNSVVQLALPVLLNGLANNTSTPEGAQSLDSALTNHHDGSILNNLGGLGNLILGQQAASPPPQLNAGGILGHILGGNQGPLVQQVSNQTGLQMGQVAQILMLLAPIVMGYLGQQKRQQNIGAEGLGSLIGGIMGGSTGQPASTGNSILDLASSFLDQDGDGSAMDDIASMAMKYIAK